jgi:hypothetical protein
MLYAGGQRSAVSGQRPSLLLLLLLLGAATVSAPLGAQFRRRAAHSRGAGKGQRPDECAGGTNHLEGAVKKGANRTVNRDQNGQAKRSRRDRTSLANRRASLAGRDAARNQKGAVTAANGCPRTNGSAAPTAKKQTCKRATGCAWIWIMRRKDETKSHRRMQVLCCVHWRWELLPCSHCSVVGPAPHHCRGQDRGPSGSSKAAARVRGGDGNDDTGALMKCFRGACRGCAVSATLPDALLAETLNQLNSYDW